MITDFDFQELKRFFDQNDTFGGSQFLSQLFERCMEEHMEDSTRGYSNPTQLQYSEPRGLTMHEYYNGHGQVRGLGINPIYMSKLEMLPGADEIDRLLTRVNVLENQMQDMYAMHSAEHPERHIPTIISTREQWDDMKDQIDDEEVVLVQTRFDRAMGVLK